MNDGLSGYELSRDWFDWCFENPELITPSHTAMYFFIIEHWNRLGQKPKFGLPMEMTKDALGIKNYKTFSKVFNDLSEWGFIKVVQKSKNQYSANIIALVKNTKALTKALTKASLKHVAKQVHGIVGVDKPNNLITKEPNNNNTPIPPQGDESENLIWKKDFKVYLKELRSNYRILLADTEWISQQEKFNPGVDIKKSIEKCCVNFWGTEAGWKKKKNSKIMDIDWKVTFANAVSKPTNRVYSKTYLEQISTSQTLKPSEPAI